MPRKTIVINYPDCHPQHCKNGMCAAIHVCQRHVLKQEEPFEKPDPPLMCVGCGICISACEKGALILI